MTTERELLPCPFCGGEAVLTPNVYAKDEGEFPGVECVECETLGPCGDDDADAVARWNRRAALAQPAPQYASPEDYARQNPLGGVARVFEVIADRLRAGENYDAVLWDYGLQRAQPAQPVAWQPITHDGFYAAPQPAPAADTNIELAKRYTSTDGAAVQPSTSDSRGHGVGLAFDSPSRSRRDAAPSTPSTAELSDDTEATALALGPIALILRGRGFPNGAAIVERAAVLIRAGRATVEEDAARYRVVQFEREYGPDKTHFCVFKRWTQPHSETGEPVVWQQALHGPALDAAIDAARGKP